MAQPTPTAADSAVRNVTVIGAGGIGVSWTALFLARGLEVVVHDVAPDAEARVRQSLDALRPSLKGLGLKTEGLTDKLRFEPDLAAAVDAADVVQENGPDRLAFKRKLWADVEAHANGRNGCRSVAEKLAIRAQRAWRITSVFLRRHIMNFRLLILSAIVALAACGNGSDSNSPVGAGSNSPVGASGGSASNIDCAAAAAAAGDFYLPPEPLPQGQPGDVIRCQPITTVHSSMADSTLIMYLSTDVYGDPIAVTGVVFEPLQPWTGDGPRPLIGLTHGTYGQGDQCASSRLLAEGVHYEPPLDVIVGYESSFIRDFLDQGIALAVTDYIGLGTPRVHTWLNRIESAQANIDAIRAARNLPGSSIPAEGPIAFSGYSQGGNAAAATAELLPSYAPELDVVGIYAGAPPTDIPQLIDFIDGRSLMGIMGYYLNGLAALYPEAETSLGERLNATGKANRAATAGQCIFETLASYPYQQSSGFTVSAETVAELLGTPPLDALVAIDRLGSISPSAPVLLAIGSNDDVVPVEGVRRLAADWCRQGATVEYFELDLPEIPGGTIAGHVANVSIIFRDKARGWLQDRFSGQPVATTCPP